MPPGENGHLLSILLDDSGHPRPKPRVLLLLVSSEHVRHQAEKLQHQNRVRKWSEYSHYYPSPENPLFVAKCARQVGAANPAHGQVLRITYQHAVLSSAAPELKEGGESLQLCSRVLHQLQILRTNVALSSNK